MNLARFMVIRCGISLAMVLTAWAGFPETASAEYRDVDVRLNVRQGETFAVLQRRAVTMARSAAQRTFDSEVLISDVSVKVTAQSNERNVTVLQMNVRRQEWVERPDAKVWAIFFPQAQSFLRLP
ncbi:MAG: hypothetical protein HC919_13800 [Oscillatoriales cyanobacterium SM2_2_1]|nr:hypothetical protein [Oscillatoriales cyanobacterium SM2_2_1]